MAASNWDTLAFAFGGAQLTGLDGLVCDDFWVRVEKDGLFFGKVGSDYPELVVHEGNFRYGPFAVAAWSGPQSGVYACVAHYVREPDGNVKYGSMQGALLAGVYGFRGDDWVGLTLESLAWFKQTLEAGKTTTAPYQVPKELDVSLLDEALRFNQGDAYLSGFLGEPIVLTRPNPSEGPAL